MKRMRENKPDPKDKPSSPLPSDEEDDMGFLGGEALSQEEYVDHIELLKQEERSRLEAKGDSEDEIEEKLKKFKKPKLSMYGHLGRLDKSIKLNDYRTHRSLETFHKLKDTYDCITLKLHRVPKDPTTIKEIDESNFYKSIFGQARNFGKAMAFLTEYRAEPEKSDKKPKKTDRNQINYRGASPRGMWCQSKLK